MNLAEMRADVRERIGERSANFWTDTFITRKLNEGQRRFAREDRWTWLQAIQTGIPVPEGTSSIELIDGVDVSRHFAVVLTYEGGDVPVIPTRIKAPNARQMQKLYTTSGEPMYWYAAQTVTNEYESGDALEVASVIKLVPAADKAYTAEYFYIRDPADMVADEDECEIPEAYQEAVIAWATAQCWLKELNGERKAQSEFSLYNTVLSQAKADQAGLALDEKLSWGGDEYKNVPYNDLHRRLFAGGPLGG